MIVNSISWLSGTDEFSYVGSAIPFDIGDLGAQTIAVKFTPTTEGSKSATFNVNSNDFHDPNVSFDVSGNAVTVSPGDANGDGNINVLDMTKVARIILQLDQPTPGANANQDGLINVLDMTCIARKILGLE